MLASRQHSWELMWWAMIALLALGLVGLASQTRILGEPTSPAPAATNPSNASSLDREAIWCQAVESFRAGDFPRAQRALDELGRDPLGADPALHVWRTLAAQARGDTAAAIHGWRTAPLELPAELYRQIGLAAAWLDRGQVDEAARALDNAWELDRDHAVVRYQFGLLNLERAHRSADWIDAAENHFRLASLGRPKVAPNSAAMYRLAAIGDLEKAIDAAPRVALDLPLAVTDSAAVLAPRVGDLLRAIGAFEFQANSHVTLAQLLLENSSLAQAESHLDSALALGRRTPYGYQELAGRFEQEHRYVDAARAAAKGFQANPQKGAAREVAANVLRGVGQLIAR